MFEINKQLKNDTHFLLKKDGFHILLHKNATIPWIILVPETGVREMFELNEHMHRSLIGLQKNITNYFRINYGSQKMNIAAIGNIVSQLHIHVIGRKKGDACWPDVVWGNNYKIHKWHKNEIKKLTHEVMK